MSYEYRNEQKWSVEDKIKEIVITTPSYVQDFAEYIKGKSREARTRLAYISDVVLFLKYLMANIPDLNDIYLYKFPIETLDALTIQDFEEYRTKLLREQTATSVKRYFSSLSLFFKFLSTREYIHKNPMEGFDAPTIKKKRIVALDSDETKQLLDGVLRNDKYRSEYFTCDGMRFGSLDNLIAQFRLENVRGYAEEHNLSLIDTVQALVKKPVTYAYDIVDIPYAVWIKRERQVLRNYAIILLFLGSGLRVSELVGLDLDDIDWKNGSLAIIAKGGNEKRVFFGRECKEALDLYIHGPERPQDLQKYENCDELEKFCFDNLASADIELALQESAIPYSPALLEDVKNYIKKILRHGRDGFKANQNYKALFLSMRGTRLGVRSVEKMIKEMVQTYLPDCRDRDIFSPHKLRATCATRILTQTGDIALAAEQLNHSSVAVTAAFYAQINKEKQKEKIQSLGLNDW